MKRINLTVFFILTLIVGFTFSYSSSSECIICTQVIPNCSSNEILVPQTCNDCAHCVSTSSTSSSGCPQVQTDCAGEPFGCKSSFGIYDPKICKCVCPDSQSSSGDLITLNKKFSGVWKSSKIIILKLCAKNNKLEGTVNITGDIENGIIVSQNIISNKEIDISTNSGKSLKLILIDARHLNILFSGQTFELRKTRPSKNCSSANSGKDCSPKGSCHGENGGKLSCPPGTKCSGLPAYGCYPPGCPVPICLSPDTKIKTDGVQKRIADIREGEIVLTDHGKAVRVKKISKTQVKNHKILKVLLSDGTVLEISPGHPTADGRKLKELKMGDILDGRMVVETKFIPYIYSHTYDILPDSKTGHYYANGVLIGSSLK